MKISNIGAGLLIALLAACSTKSVKLNASDYNDALNKSKNVQLIDVRTAGEFNAGYIDGAQNIDFYSADFKQKIQDLDKSAPVFVYCKSGGRSSSAAAIFHELGFKEVVDLDGGLIQWANQDLPLAGVKVQPKTGFGVEEYFEEVKAHDLVLVDFFATWCGPCKQMAPHIKTVNENNPQLKVLKVDTDKSPDISRHFGISGIPLVKVYSQGEEVYSKVGYHSESELLSALSAYL